MKRSSLMYLIAGSILAVYAYASTLDAEDAERDFQHYCNMVEKGYWPDYRNMTDECDTENS